jgi:hypothetical protein
MYRTSAEPPTATEKRKKFQWPTRERVHAFFVGVGGMGLFFSFITFVIGTLIHSVLIPDDKVPHTDPLAVTFFYGLSLFGFSVATPSLLYGAFLVFAWLFDVARGKEQF